MNARDMEQFVEWCHDEDLRLRREAETDPELAALLVTADEQYAAQYGKPWVNPKATVAS